MNGSIIYLTLFGSKILWNDITHHAASTLTESFRTTAKPIRLPNGRLYDFYQTYDAPVEPAPFTFLLFLKMTRDAAVAEFESLATLVGTRGLLTAKRLTTAGTTTTCTARLTAVANMNRDSADNTAGLLIKLSFTPIDLWS